MTTWGRWLLLGFVLIALMATSAAGAEPKRVLIVHSAGSSAPPDSTHSTAFQMTLKKEMGERVDIDEVSLDIARYGQADMEGPFVQFLLARLTKWQPDLVVPIASPAGRFVAKYRDRLFPTAPVIYTGMDQRTLPPDALQTNATFVGESFDIAGLVEDILQLAPDTNHIAVVIGATPLERYWTTIFQKEFERYTNRVHFTWFNDLSFDEMRRRVATLPPHSFILLALLLRDGSGVTHNQDAALQQLRAVANAPINGIYQNQLGLGLVGGRLYQAEAEGEESARIAIRVLRGEPISKFAPLIIGTQPQPRYDWRELQRWNISEARLPPGSVIEFRQPMVWQQYRWHVVSAVGLIAAQMTLIVTLLVQRRRRREAQADLAERLRFEMLVSDVITACATATLDQLDGRIRDGLQRVATFLGVDRGSLWQRAPQEKSLLSLTHAWERSGAHAPRMIFNLQLFSYLRARMDADDVLRFATPDELPPEAAAERAESRRVGVRSFAAIPLRAGDHLHGVLVFLSLHTEREWPGHIVQQLRTLAEPFSTALLRVQSAAAVQSSVAMAGAVLAALPGETAIIDSDGTIVQTNDAWATAARSEGSAQSALKVGANYLDACRNAVDMPPNIARRLHAAIESILRRERDDFAVEYLTSRGGENRWFEARVRRLTRFVGGAAVMHFDVTARRQAEAAAQLNLGQIAHLDRVAAVGQLASSMAHELNQPLAGILANAQAAKRWLAGAQPDLDEVQACLADIVSDDKRASEVIRRMRQLLKKTDFVMVPLALNDLASNTIRLVANDALRHAVTIDFLPELELPVIYGDAVQIQQVILNLLTNAIAAAANGGGSTRTVSVWTSVAAAPYVELGVHDTGKGIAEADRERIFEPFFTTKAEGLGMGLTISRTIVEAHGGRVLVENDPAGGAIFRVRLRTDQPATT
jgi:signal transduction histidine kinase